jgi:hypothetical protein
VTLPIRDCQCRLRRRRGSWKANPRSEATAMVVAGIAAEQVLQVERWSPCIVMADPRVKELPEDRLSPLLLSRPSEWAPCHDGWPGLILGSRPGTATTGRPSGDGRPLVRAAGLSPVVSRQIHRSAGDHLTGFLPGRWVSLRAMHRGLPGNATDDHHVFMVCPRAPSSRKAASADV